MYQGQRAIQKNKTDQSGRYSFVFEPGESISISYYHSTKHPGKISELSSSRSHQISKILLPAVKENLSAELRQAIVGDLGWNLQRESTTSTIDDVMTKYQESIASLGVTIAEANRQFYVLDVAEPRRLEALGWRVYEPQLQ